MSNLDQFTFGFYPLSTKTRSNFIKYHEPTKLYPSNSDKININLNSYRQNTNLLRNKHRHIHKKKDHSNNFNVNHKSKINNMINSHSKIENNNLAQMLSNLKQEITEITNNIKETDNKVEYYMNKNIENSKKIRHNSASANISKNTILLPRKKYAFSNRGGISLNLINSNYSKSTNYIRNQNKKDRIVTEYVSNLNTNTNYNNNGAGLTYNLYTQKNKYNDNLNHLTIQTTNNNPLNKLNCLRTYYDRRKLCNNYLNELRPKYHTCENFYHRDRKKKPCTYIYKSSNINCNMNNINDFDNSNKISDKSSIYFNHDFINDSLKKILKSSSHKNNLMNMNKYLNKNYNTKKRANNNFKKGHLELQNKYNITSPNRIGPCGYENNLSFNIFKNDTEERKCDKYDLMNNFTNTNNYCDDIIKDRNLLEIDLKLKDEKIYNLNKEIQRLKNSINIKNSIINILKYGNNNNDNFNNIKLNNDYNKENINGVNEIYPNNNPNKNVSNITLNNNIKTLQNEISKLRYNLNLQKNDDYLSLQNKNKELINENLSLKEQLKNMIDIYQSNEKTKLENEINSRDKKIQVLMNDIADYDRDKKILQEEIKKLNEELSNKQNNNNDDIQINDEINKYIQENDNLKKIKEENEIYIEKLNKEIIDIENKYKNIISELNSEISNYKNKLQENDINIANQNKNIEKIKSLENSITNKETIIINLKNKNNDLNQSNTKLTAQISELNKQITQQKSIIEKLQKENAEQKTEINNNISEMIDLKKQQENQNNDYEIKIVELEEKIKELENKEIKDKDDNEIEDNEETEMLNQQIEELNKSLEEWKNKKEKLEIKCSNLSEEVNKLNELIALNQEDNKTLKNKVNNHLKQIKELNEKIELLQKENESLKGEK